MDKDCVFCKIVNDEIPSYKIYEDDFCVAFLDTANDAYGHTLVIPKRHLKSMMSCDMATINKVMAICKMIGTHYVEDCGFEGYNIFTCAGESADQSVFHMHFHLIPRKKGDNNHIFAKLSGSGVDLKNVYKKLKFADGTFDKHQPHEKVSKGTVVLYTDGACSGNPGKGGWGSIIIENGVEKVMSGGEMETTNNQMELMSVIQGIEYLGEGKKINVFSDSAYVVNAFNWGWIEKWKKTHWRNSDGNIIANKDLWFRLLDAIAKHREVVFTKVKGHADNDYNNRCDALARNEILKLEG